MFFALSIKHLASDNLLSDKLPFNYAVRLQGIMKKIRNLYIHCSCMLLIGIWPQLVSGDGGIASLGALRPVFAFLSFLALALFIWLVISSNLFVTRPKKITKRKINFYNGYSIFVLVLLLAGCFLGTLLAGVLASIVFLVLIVVLAITIGISSRAQRLMKSDLVAEE